MLGGHQTENDSLFFMRKFRAMVEAVLPSFVILNGIFFNIQVS